MFISWYIFLTHFLKALKITIFCFFYFDQGFINKLPVIAAKVIYFPNLIYQNLSAVIFQHKFHCNTIIHKFDYPVCQSYLLLLKHILNDHRWRLKSNWSFYYFIFSIIIYQFVINFAMYNNTFNFNTKSQLSSSYRYKRIKNYLYDTEMPLGKGNFSTVYRATQ